MILEQSMVTVGAPYIDQHILNEKKKNVTEKSVYSLDWPQKSLWYDPPNLDNTLWQNLKEIWWILSAIVFTTVFVFVFLDADR